MMTHQVVAVARVDTGRPAIDPSHPNRVGGAHASHLWSVTSIFDPMDQRALPLGRRNALHSFIRPHVTNLDRHLVRDAATRPQHVTSETITSQR
jgi:hypothetical protein